METTLKKAIHKMFAANVILWLTVLLTGSMSIWFFRCFDPQEDLMAQGNQLIILKSACFFVSLAVCILCLILVIKSVRCFKIYSLRGGNLLLGSLWLMIFATVFSVQSIPGINLNFGLLAMEGLPEIFHLSAMTGIFSLIAMTAFIVAVILNYAGIANLTKGRKDEAAALKGLEKVKKSGLVLMLTVLTFSPILISYIAANINKYEDTTIFNIITAVVYLVAIVYYLFTLKNVKLIQVIPANEIIEPAYVPMDSTLKESISQSAKWLLYTWAVILVSFILMSAFYLSASKLIAALTLIPYIAGWIMIIQGIRVTSKLNDQLKQRNIRCGRYFVISYVALALIAFLSFNTLVGGNIMTLGSLDWESVSEIFSEWSDIDSMDSFIEFSSLISLFLFILFPVFILIGCSKLSLIIPAFKKSIIGAFILVLSSIIFAPLSVFMAIEEWDGEPIIYLIFACLSYFIGIVLYVKPRMKCETIDEKFGSLPLSENRDNSENGDQNQYIRTLLNDKKALATGVVGLIAIVISFITVISFISGPTSAKRSGAIPENGMEEISEISSNLAESDISGSEYGMSIHPDGYYREDELEVEVSGFINNFYARVIPKINNSQDYEYLIKENFTPEFFEIYRTVDEDVEDGDIGFFDFDFITFSQDPDISGAIIESIDFSEDANGQIIANVDISLKDGTHGGQSRDIPIEMQLLKTPKGWKIKDYNNLLHEMKNFKSEMKSQK